jgi:hypothetical protein
MHDKEWEQKAESVNEKGSLEKELVEEKKSAKGKVHNIEEYISQ